MNMTLALDIHLGPQAQLDKHQGLVLRASDENPKHKKWAISVTVRGNVESLVALSVVDAVTGANVGGFSLVLASNGEPYAPMSFHGAPGTVAESQQLDLAVVVSKGLAFVQNHKYRLAAVCRLVDGTSAWAYSTEVRVVRRPFWSRNDGAAAPGAAARPPLGGLRHTVPASNGWRKKEVLCSTADKMAAEIEAEMASPSVEVYAFRIRSPDSTEVGFEAVEAEVAAATSMSPLDGMSLLNGLAAEEVWADDAAVNDVLTPFPTILAEPEVGMPTSLELEVETTPKLDAIDMLSAEALLMRGPGGDAAFEKAVQAAQAYELSPDINPMSPLDGLAAEEAWANDAAVNDVLLEVQAFETNPSPNPNPNPNPNRTRTRTRTRSLTLALNSSPNPNPNLNPNPNSNPNPNPNPNTCTLTRTRLCCWAASPWRRCRAGRARGRCGAAAPSARAASTTPTASRV